MAARLHLARAMVFPSRMHELRVVPRNLRWEVSVDGVTRRLIDWLCTKERAIEHAFEQARELLRFEPQAQAVVIVHRADRSEEERLVVAASQNAS